MSSTEDPIERFVDAAAFEAWLEANADVALGVRIAMAKKSTGISSIDWDQAVDVALCFGWIDGQRFALDEREFLQRFTPRRRRSTWSQANRDRVARLTDEGRMRPRGQAEVEAAKADGRWEAAYASPRNAVPPPDFVAAMAASPGTAEAFAALDSRNRFAFVFSITTAKKPETRAARIAKAVAMLETGEKVYP